MNDEMPKYEMPKEDPFDIEGGSGSSEKDIDKIIEESEKENIIKEAEYFEILKKYDIEKMINRIELSGNIDKAEDYIKEMKNSRKNIANYYDLKESYNKKEEMADDFSEQKVEEKEELIRKILKDAQINEEKNNMKNLIEKIEDPEILIMIQEEIEAKIKDITKQKEINKEDFNTKREGIFAKEKLSEEKSEAITSINNLESILYFTITEKEKRNFNKLVNNVNELAEKNEDKEELFEMIEEYIDRKKKVIAGITEPNEEKIHRKAIEYVIEQNRIQAMLDKK
ncbi:MAG: hypothetical protein KAU07_02860 [Candidatus Andersenbacteria bacterium]|nr:hypothetical protein [Candidatus Andersenbacteria bacterium]